MSVGIATMGKFLPQPKITIQRGGGGGGVPARMPAFPNVLIEVVDERDDIDFLPSIQVYDIEENGTTNGDKNGHVEITKIIEEEE